MDSTDTLAATCILSKWSKDPEECRRCSRKLTGRSWKWCSKKCYRVWRQNHYYRKARSECKRLSRKPCLCPRVKSHPTCSACGICEGQANKLGYGLEINHIVPRNGTPINLNSCQHHLTNLAVLCHRCHTKETARQKKEGLINAKRNATR